MMNCSIKKTSLDKQFISAQKTTYNFILSIQHEKEHAMKLLANEKRKTTENPLVHCVIDMEDISGELKELKRKEFLEEARSQLLRRNNEELRQLERQLQAAEISKALSDQRMNKQILKAQELKEKQDLSIKTKLQNESTAKTIADEERIEREKKAQFRAELRKQMDDITHRRRIEFENKMRDREEIDKMLKKFAHEQFIELEDLRHRKQVANQELHNFLQERELEKQMKIMESANKLKEDLNYQNVNLAIQENIKRENEEKMRKKTEISNKIGENIYNIEQEKRRRDEVLVNLLIEERKAKEECQYRLQLEHQRQQLDAMKAEEIKDRENMRRFKELASAQASAEDSCIKKEQMRIQKNEDREKKLARERYLLKQKEHAQAIQNLIAENRQKKLAETTLSVLERKSNLEAERLRLQEIRKERMNILSKQSPEVLTFLPTQSLQETERKFLKIDQLPKSGINSLQNLLGDGDYKGK